MAYLTLRICGCVTPCLEKKFGNAVPDILVLGVDYPVAFTTLSS